MFGLDDKAKLLRVEMNSVAMIDLCFRETVKKDTIRKFFKKIWILWQLLIRGFMFTVLFYRRREAVSLA